MGRLFLEFVDEDTGAKFVCSSCTCDIASEAGLLWEGWMGAATPALLFRAAVNTEPRAAKREEVLSTGRYTLVDVRCRTCRATLGWQYLSAEQADQAYKVGAYLMRQAALARVSSMQVVVPRAAPLAVAGQRPSPSSPSAAPATPSARLQA